MLIKVTRREKYEKDRKRRQKLRMQKGTEK